MPVKDAWGTGISDVASTLRPFSAEAAQPSLWRPLFSGCAGGVALGPLFTPHTNPLMGL